MKTQLRFLVLLCTFVYSNMGYSQVNYTEDFDDEPEVWQEFDFFITDEFACANFSLVGNFYYYDYPEWEYTDDEDVEVVSPLLGTANGQLATLSYTYKLLNYNTEEAQENTSSWGSFTVYYGSSVDGPWTVIHTVNNTNHVVSEDCATKTATFTPTEGSQVYLRIFGDNGNIEGTDVILFVDDISFTQPIVACAGVPATATAQSSKGLACSTDSFTLSYSPAATATGITHQWQWSADGVAYSDIVGATSATYTTTQTATKWYRVNVTCAATTATVTSSGFRVLHNANCYCNDLAFDEGVEPITLVNFAGINNTSTAALSENPDHYIQNFTGLAPGSVNIGQTYPIVLKGNTAGPYESFFKVYIDFNHNGNLGDTGEGFELGSIEDSSGIDALQLTGNIAIPGTAFTGYTLMRVVKHYNYEDSEIPSYLPTSCGSDENTGYGQAEDYLLDIQPCATLPPVAEEEQTLCAGASVYDIATTGTAVKWYSDDEGGTALAEDFMAVDGVTYYASQTVGCESIARTPVTVTLTTVELEIIDDVNVCSEYMLSTLFSGNYYTEPGGQGEMLEGDDIISESTTLYVYGVGPGPLFCTAEYSFEITINNVEAEQLEDVTVCSEYVLPELSGGNYYTGASGAGDMLEAGDVITGDTTLYVYAQSPDNAMCTAQTSFSVTVINIQADELDDVSTCSGYLLPELSAGNNYYTETGMGGTMLSAGDLITTDMTIYIHTLTGDVLVCSDETSFDIEVDLIVPPAGQNEYEFIVDDLTDFFFLYQAELEVEGEIRWYESEEDAENGVNPISEDFVVPAGVHTYYVTQTVGECESEPYAVTVEVIVLGTEDFDIASFRYYPNPATDVLNLSYSENITSIEITNVLGQQVMSGKYNDDKVQLNISQLAEGTYMVKVQTENASKVIKMIKNK